MNVIPGTWNPENRLSNDGQKEGFQTLHRCSDNTAQADSDAITTIGQLTSEFITTTKEAQKAADTEAERDRRIHEAMDALTQASENILEINRRSHRSQQGFSTLAAVGMLALAGVIFAARLGPVARKIAGIRI